MTIRASLAARISMIVAMALLAAWLLAIAQFYVVQERQLATMLLPPTQVAALVALLEDAPGAQRSRILDAVTGNDVVARLEPSDNPTPWPMRARTIDPEALAGFRQALGDRLLRAAYFTGEATGMPFPRLLSTRFSSMVIRVGLASGEVLVIERQASILLNSIGLPVGFGAGLFGTLIALLALVIIHRETRPLARLVAAVDRMDLTGKPITIQTKGSRAPEVRALIAAFNRLQERLGGLLQARMAMLGGISHDVRTFATRLRLRIDRIPDPAERSRAVADIEDMIRLLDDSLLTSRAGAGELALDLVEVVELIEAEILDRSAAASRLHLLVEPGARRAQIIGDRLAIRRIVANLIDNALHYAGKAWVRLDIDGTDLVLQVDDDGPGIPVDRRNDLMEPFVRLETSRSRRSGGAGLGLSVVRSLVEAHRGIVSIGDAPSGGTRIDVRLPLFIADR